MQPTPSSPAAPDGRAAMPRRHVSVQLADEPAVGVASAVPAKTGMMRTDGIDDRRRESRSDETAKPGERAVYILVFKGADDRQTPVFASGPEQPEEAVLVFPSREKAGLYLQVARWDDYQLLALTPRQLSAWLLRVRDEGIAHVIVDPNRLDQQRGVPQPLLRLQGRLDLSGEHLYEEVRALANA